MATDIGKRAALVRHPHFLEWEADWRKLADVLEGTGGFKAGERFAAYLVAHPREWTDHTAANPRNPTKKLKERRKLARYENFAASILKQTMTALFRETPMRMLGVNEGKKQDEKAKPTGIEAWWKNVEGKQSRKVDIDNYLQRCWKASANFGHTIIYMDRSNMAASTAADMGQPFLRCYAPLDIADWLEDEQGNLVSVKLIEPVQRKDFTEAPARADRVQYREVNEEGWIVYDLEGKKVDEGEHGMGILPCIELFAERRLMYQHIGQSILGDPQLYIDHFNLTSEMRELFRKQAFSVLNIPLGTGPDAMDVENAKKLLNQETGTEGVIFSGAAAQFLSADAANMIAYMDQIQQLVRTIYRLAGVFFESDSKDAEAEGSLKIKREDMAQRLSGYADELQQADEAIAELWYRAEYGADGWESHWEKDEVTIQYPESFDMTPFDVVLEQAQAAMSLGMPPAVLKELRKQLLSKFLPNLGPNKKRELEAEVDNMEDDVSPQDMGQARLTAFKNTGKMPPKGEAA